MRLQRDAVDLITRHVKGRPLTLRCSPKLIEELDALVMNGYARSPWGGVEVGGVLFGQRERDGVHIRSYRTLDCEHQQGPSFELSAKDLARLDGLLASAETDDNLKDLVPIGWYHSVSQREFCLSEPAIAVHNRSFPEPWQIAVVLKRSKKDPVLFGFFFRDDDGSVNAQEPHTFTVDDLRARQPETQIPDTEEVARSPKDSAVVKGQEPELSARLTIRGPLLIPEAERQPFRENTASTKTQKPRTFTLDALRARPPAEQSPKVEEATPPPAGVPAGDVHEPAALTPVSMPGPVLIPEAEPKSPRPELPESPYAFLGLSADPFSQTPDTSFLYPSAEHVEAMASLLYGIRARKGFLLLIGAAGTGKTMVLECLIDKLNHEAIDFAFLFNSKITTEQFFEFLAYDLDLECSQTKKVSVLNALNERLVNRFQEGRTTVLIVDNAQKLSLEILEEIELIGNLESRRGKLLQVVFAGQPSLERLIERPELRGLRQRILFRGRLAPLSADQTVEYIETRLAHAGLARQRILSADLLPEIHARTRGIPRLINAVCGGLLAACCECRTNSADLRMLDQVSAELELDQLILTLETDLPQPNTAVSA